MTSNPQSVAHSCLLRAKLAAAAAVSNPSVFVQACSDSPDSSYIAFDSPGVQVDSQSRVAPVELFRDWQRQQRSSSLLASSSDSANLPQGCKRRLNVPALPSTSSSSSSCFSDNSSSLEDESRFSKRRRNRRAVPAHASTAPASSTLQRDRSSSLDSLESEAEAAELFAIVAASHNNKFGVTSSSLASESSPEPPADVFTFIQESPLVSSISASAPSSSVSSSMPATLSSLHASAILAQAQSLPLAKSHSQLLPPHPHPQTHQAQSALAIRRAVHGPTPVVAVNPYRAGQSTATSSLSIPPQVQIPCSPDVPNPQSNLASGVSSPTECTASGVTSESVNNTPSQVRPASSTGSAVAPHRVTSSVMSTPCQARIPASSPSSPKSFAPLDAHSAFTPVTAPKLGLKSPTPRHSILASLIEDNHQNASRSCPPSVNRSTKASPLVFAGQQASSPSMCASSRTLSCESPNESSQIEFRSAGSPYSGSSNAVVVMPSMASPPFAKYSSSSPVTVPSESVASGSAPSAAIASASSSSSMPTVAAPMVALAPFMFPVAGVNFGMAPVAANMSVASCATDGVQVAGAGQQPLQQQQQVYPAAMLPFGLLPFLDTNMLQAIMAQQQQQPHPSLQSQQPPPPSNSTAPSSSFDAFAALLQMQQQQLMSAALAMVQNAQVAAQASFLMNNGPISGPTAATPAVGAPSMSPSVPSTHPAPLPNSSSSSAASSAVSSSISESPSN